MNEIIYITYPKAKHDEFNNLYFLATGEYLQDNPPENEKGDLCLIGSSRIKPEKVDVLKILLPEATIERKSERFPDIDESLPQAQKDALEILREAKKNEFKSSDEWDRKKGG